MAPTLLRYCHHAPAAATTGLCNEVRIHLH
uniref:Uncharacterized protein n=2 Tax=Anguilla anguilla TaxID=7936 RepID=A0A0E9QW70_ANGAN